MLFIALAEEGIRDGERVIMAAMNKGSRYYYARMTLPVLNFVYYVGKLLRFALLIIGFSLLLYYGLILVSHNSDMPFLTNLEEVVLSVFPYLNQLHLPVIGGIQIPGVIFIGTIFVVCMIISWALRRIRKYAKHVVLRVTIDQLDTAPISSKAPEELKQLESTIEEVVSDSPAIQKGEGGRKEMLELYQEVRSNLEEMKVDLTFLSIDVVDSTGMKEGEESVTVEADFSQYNKLIEAAFDRHGYLKAAWTPDGVMCCFATADAAVSAAREIIDAMVQFNMTKKFIKRDFSIRCGCNSGKVPYDEGAPLEALCDHVIDVAGHFQKHGMTDSICISKNTYDRLSKPAPFRLADMNVDGIDMYIQHMDSSKKVKPLDVIQRVRSLF